MKNTIRVFCLLSVCLGLSACGEEYDQKTFKSFEEICLFSNGTFDSKGKCKCGGDTCDNGVVCENGKCANKIVVETQCENNSTKCEDNKLKQCSDGQWIDKIECDSCENGICSIEEKCEDEDNKCEDGIISVCETEELTLNVCPFGATCKNSTECNDCGDGFLKCEEKDGIGYSSICQNGTWSEISECSDDGVKFSCKNEYQCGSCINGETVCVTANNVSQLDTCVNGQWNIANKIRCDYGCDESGKRCKELVIEQECNEEDEGKERCENGKYQICKNGVWSDDVISCPDGCVTTENGGVQCKQTNCAGEYPRCQDEKTLVKCEDNTVIEENCEFGCDNNKCKECSNKCVNENLTGNINIQNAGSYRECINGNLSGPIQCIKDEKYVSCNDDGNACGECLNGAKKCETGKAYTCTDGSWGDGTSCPNGCKDDTCASNEVVGVCQEGEVKCIENKINECVKNGNGVFEFNATNIDCKCNNEKQCVDYENKSVVYTCNGNNILNGSQECNGVSCNDTGTACGECLNNSISCTNDGNVGKYNKCQNGLFGKEETCKKDEKDVSCNDTGTACGECLNGDIKCLEDGEYKKCIRGEWVGKQCVSGQTCDPVNGCEVNTTTKQICKTVEDKVGFGYKYGYIIVGSEITGLCPGGCQSESECNNNCISYLESTENDRCISQGNMSEVFTCNGTEWELVSSCLLGCNDNGINCKSCTPEDKCQSNDREFSCKNEFECGVCKNGDTNYITLPPLSGKNTQPVDCTLKCDSGQWVNNGCVSEFDNDDIYVCKHGDGYYGGRDVIYMYGKTNENWDEKNKFWNITVCKVDEHCEKTLGGSIIMCIKNDSKEDSGKI